MYILLVKCNLDECYTVLQVHGRIKPKINTNNLKPNDC